MFCGMFAYQYYLESKDDQNIYGDGVHRVPQYNVALNKPQKNHFDDKLEDPMDISLQSMES